MEDIPFYFEYKAYTLGFKTDVLLGNELLKTRPLIHLRVHVKNRGIFFSEIAPLPGFGTEAVSSALHFCKNFSEQTLTLQSLKKSLAGLPCCQTALERALYLALDAPRPLNPENLSFENTALFSLDQYTLESIERSMKQGFQSFKLKVGLQPFEVEKTLIIQILSSIAKPGALRLDANGRLSLVQTRAYLEFLEGKGLAFLEQPLPPGEEEAMLALGKAYSTPLAWDESISSVASLIAASQKGFEGIYVIKPSLLGSLKAFLNWRQQEPTKQLVYSSAFESSLGLEGLLALAYKAPTSLPLGLGTLAYLTPSPLVWHAFGPRVYSQPALSQANSAQLFNLY